MHTNITATARFDNNLVSELPLPGPCPISTDFERIEILSGAFEIAVLEHGTLVSHSRDGSLPFIATLYSYLDRPPVTVYLPNLLLPNVDIGRGYLVSDPFDMGDSEDDLCTGDDKDVRGALQ